MIIGDQVGAKHQRAVPRTTVHICLCSSTRYLICLDTAACIVLLEVLHPVLRWISIEAFGSLQVLSMFQGRPMRIFVDGTLGAGGHSAAVLTQHPNMQLLIGIDKDPVAHSIAQKRLEQAKSDTHSSVTLRHVLVSCMKMYLSPSMLHW